jgi:shikimate kinase
MRETSALKGRRIALVGFMGSGKSRVGRLLASQLAVPFLDLDDEIERRAGMSVHEIFEKEGDASFRRREELALSDVAARSGGFVLACGGGTVLSPASRSLLARDFLSVWIDVPFAEITKRLGCERENRPLLAMDDYERRAEEMLRGRRPLYEEAGRFVYRWKEGDSTTESAAEILSLIEEQLL